MRIVDVFVSEALRLLDMFQPGIESFRFTDGRRKAAEKYYQMSSTDQGVNDNIAYMMGQGANSIICSHTAPPSC